jgi:hypothetical protein
VLNSGQAVELSRENAPVTFGFFPLPGIGKLRLSLPTFFQCHFLRIVGRVRRIDRVDVGKLIEGGVERLTLMTLLVPPLSTNRLPLPSNAIFKGADNELTVVTAAP